MLYRNSDAPALTLTTGPVVAYPEVLRALATPVGYDYDPIFLSIYESVVRKLDALVKSETPPVILHAEAVVALEAAAASLIGPGDVVLNLVSGVYGKGFEPWAVRAGARIVELRVPYDQVIEAEMVAAALKTNLDITVVVACHLDTPSGTVNPIDAIGTVVARHGAFLVVDAVSSFAGMPVDASSCKADLFVTGPHKCLGCPPGLSIIGVSNRAWEKMLANPTAPRASVLSLLDWKDAWKADAAFPFSPSGAEVHALDAAIDRHIAEGEIHVFERHALTARAFRAGIVAMGLELWASERFAAPTTTVVRLPPGIDEAELRVELRASYGLVLSAGRGELAGKVVRVGHMGISAQPIHAVAALAALGGAFASLGCEVNVGQGVESALDIMRRRSGMTLPKK